MSNPQVKTALLVQSVYCDQLWSNIKSTEYLCEMKTGQTYRGDRATERARERERASMCERDKENGLEEKEKGRNDVWNQHLSIFRDWNQ